MFKDNFDSNLIYTPGEIQEMLQVAMDKVKINRKRVYRGQSVEYYNCPAGFDIETSSFLDNHKEKTAIMYEWTLGINGCVMLGRTWEELQIVLDVIADCLKLNDHKRLLIGVHNLSYEFQFICQRFTWYKVFATDTRKPIYAVTDTGLEFRDTYILSGYKLEIVGKNLHTYKVKKMVGDLDYKKIRTYKTALTPKEIGYCVNDVKIVMAYLQECIEAEKNITYIPLTKTGYVRKYVRKKCFGSDAPKEKRKYKRWNYMELMAGLTLESAEYKQLKRAFQGGFTHASPYYSGQLCHNVQSMDLTSSYPTQLCLPKFPMSKGIPHTVTSLQDFKDSIKYYCCLFDVEITGLYSKFMYDSYLSLSRCRDVKGAIISNGRIVSADHLVTTITEQDYTIISRVYGWQHFRVGNMIRYQRGYLPRDFVRAVLSLYKSKTELKGLQGSDNNGIPYSVTYLARKGMLNSCFGMCVTDIVRDEISYTDKWIDEIPNLDAAIAEYNTNKNRFMFYPWGVWCTACARVAVWSAIFNLREDYIYCDTDSVKYLHAEKHQDYFNRYNDYIINSLHQTCKHYQLDPDYIAPQNNKGNKKQLGIWDFDGYYNQFKTLGAKRYMLQYSNDPRNGSDAGKYSLTVSGLNKSITMPYLLKKYGEQNIFNKFSADLHIPADYTGKNTHTYIDTPRVGIITDYHGIPAAYAEKSCIHLSGSDYYLSISQEYKDFLLDIQEGEI